MLCEICEIYCALCGIVIKNFFIFRGAPNGLFKETFFPRVKLDKGSIPELRFLIKKCRTSWFCETVTTFVVCSVRVATLTEHTMNNLSCDCRLIVYLDPKRM